MVPATLISQIAESRPKPVRFTPRGLFCIFLYQCTADPRIVRPAGWSSWQLVGLITRRSQVQVLPPQPDLKARSVHAARAFCFCVVGVIVKNPELFRHSVMASATQCTGIGVSVHTNDDRCMAWLSFVWFARVGAATKKCPYDMCKLVDSIRHDSLGEGMLARRRKLSDVADVVRRIRAARVTLICRRPLVLALKAHQADRWTGLMLSICRRWRLESNQKVTTR
ncbi:hypothetical protein ACUXG4_001289 [Cupriavidus metallidurans]